MKQTYNIQDREAGNIIVSGLTLKNAQNFLRGYEETDRANHEFTPNFYEIGEDEEIEKSYFAKSKKEYYTFRATDNEDARHWIINHLDTSQEWNYGLVVYPLQESFNV
jgi:hypothetical protein